MWGCPVWAERGRGREVQPDFKMGEDPASIPGKRENICQNRTNMKATPTPIYPGLLFELITNTFHNNFFKMGTMYLSFSFRSPSKEVLEKWGYYIF